MSRIQWQGDARIAPLFIKPNESFDNIGHEQNPI